MIVKSGIVTQQAVNNITSLNPNISDEELRARQQFAEKQEAERLVRMQQMMDNLEQTNKEKKWTVPFN